MFAISFVIFFVFFFIRKKLSNDEYAIKNTFNEINKVSNMDHFTYLSILAKKNPQLNDLMNDFNESKAFFEQQIKLVKEKIISLTSENEEFSFGSAKKLRDEINKDLASCSEMSETLKKIMSNSTSYSKTVSDLLTQYRLLTDGITQFYELNLSLQYNSEVFANMDRSINDCLVEASDYVIKIDNNKLIKSLNNLNSHIT
ncbi:MAG: hypothetical protein K2M43_00975, partial [Mycoplasmoidaceae bacterium]|nr:hypothetical protein [Mycoplasmoidaceae bacterium]